MSKTRDQSGSKPQTPINFGTRSNGEFFEAPTEKDALIEKLVLAKAEDNAKRLGIDRRSFLGSAAGMATTLAVVNLVHGCGSDDDDGPAAVQCDDDGARELLGGDDFVMDVQSHQIDQSMEWRDPVHGDWTETNKLYYSFFCSSFDGSSVSPAPGEPKVCDAATPDRFPSWIDPAVGIEEVLNQCRGELNHAPCLGLDDYMDLMFRRSDTTVAVLSTFPAITCEQAEMIGYSADLGICGDFLPTAAMANTRKVVNERAGSQRCLSHAAVLPNAPSWLSTSERQAFMDEQLRGMETAVRDFGIDAWKCYTPFGAIPIEQVEGLRFADVVFPIISSEFVGEGWLLTDEAGQAMIEKAIELDRPIINAHKGVPLPSFNPDFTTASDVGIVAKKYPAAKFVVYHSAINHGNRGFGAPAIPEGPYDPDEWGPDDDPLGMNSLIHAMVINGITPENNDNVYAELGGPGARAIGDPVQGTHIFGKLLKYVGEDRILWGTDSIWGGSPQSLIEGFRAFRMIPEIAEAHDYPELTPAIKAKILGLNAAVLYGIDAAAARCTLAEDKFAAERRDWQYARRVSPSPIHPLEVNQGPRTRREFFNLWKSKSWFPV